MKTGLNYYNRDRALIDKTLKKYLNRLKGPRALRKAMEYTVLNGGKRLRPVLALESARTLNADIKRALPYACAVELIHNFSLVHDDLPSMDDDDLRRGKPACHKKFGEALAVLAGDALLNLAFGIISAEKKKKGLEIASLLSDAVGTANMIGGQVLDLKCKRIAGKNANFKKRIDAMKTAALMAASCEVGALAAGAKKSAVERMRKFGINLGFAFQITDDILDSEYKKSALYAMRKKAKSLIASAKRDIVPFGKKADTLRYIADSIAKRTEKA